MKPLLHIARTGRRLARGARILALFVPLGVVLYWFLAGASLPPPRGISPELMAGVGSTQRFLGGLVSLLPALAISGALLALARICDHYGRGELFTPAIPPVYRCLGRALAATTLFNWLQPTLLTLVLTWHRPAGHRMLTLGISSDDVFMVLTTAVVFLLAWVMSAAAELQADNAAIV